MIIAVVIHRERKTSFIGRTFQATNLTYTVAAIVVIILFVDFLPTIPSFYYQKKPNNATDLSQIFSPVVVWVKHSVSSSMYCEAREFYNGSICEFLVSGVYSFYCIYQGTVFH